MTTAADNSTISLHKFGIVPDEEESHVFTFVFENPHRLLGDVKFVESSEVSYRGHRWSLVCTRKEERYLGIFLKWRYTDGPSASHVTAKAKFSLGLVHRQDYSLNKYFNSNQKFSSAQALLGKSKFVPVDELLGSGSGFLDDTGRNVILELGLFKCVTHYEKAVDVSPKERTRKNANGFYFDSPTFVFANQRWYLRVYPTKANSNGLPAVYLYLATKTQGLSIETQFQLHLGSDVTEILTYTFGEGAKFDGFGKTLPHTLANVDKIKELTIGVHIFDMAVTRNVTLSLVQPTGSVSAMAMAALSRGATPTAHLRATPTHGEGFMSPTPLSLQGSTDSFVDTDGNQWRLDIDRSAQRLTLTMGKGVHHYQHNRTQLLCWSASLISRDSHAAPDIDMRGEPIVGYFSNFIDDKGYLVNFPVERKELEDRASYYVSDQRTITVRVVFLTVQSLPIAMRSVPHFEYQIKHLLRARRLLQEQHRNLEEMREMSASRASMSLMDLSNVGVIDDLAPPPAVNQQSTPLITPPNPAVASKIAVAKQLFSNDMQNGVESVNAKSSGIDDAEMKKFVGDFLGQLARKADQLQAASTSAGQGQGRTAGDGGSEVFRWTARDASAGGAQREDLSTESGITVSDESSLLMDARPSAVDVSKQKAVASTLAQFLRQRLPIRVTEVVELGSLGTGTPTKSRSDIDIVLLSPDVPTTVHQSWLAPLLQLISRFIQHACANPDNVPQLPKCSQFTTSSLAVQFSSGGLDIDVMLAHDWEADGGAGYGALYDHSCKQRSLEARTWCALSVAKLTRRFLSEQPAESKEVVKVLKHWRNTVLWKKTTYRPNSYLLALLAIKAVDDCRSHELKAVLRRVGELIMRPELSISWSVYYIADKFPVEFDPPHPLVRDPANPAVNVASSLAYWGQFRAEYVQWMRSMNIKLNLTDT